MPGKKRTLGEALSAAIEKLPDEVRSMNDCEEWSIPVTLEDMPLRTFLKLAGVPGSKEPTAKSIPKQKLPAVPVAPRQNVDARQLRLLNDIHKLLDAQLQELSPRVAGDRLIGVWNLLVVTRDSLERAIDMLKE